MRALMTTAAVWLMAGGGAMAQDAASIVQSIPGAVTEVTTGGAWTNAGQTGAFRAIVVTGAPGAEAPVTVHLQLVAFSGGGADATVLKTTPIKEVTERKLQNAFVNFDADAENKATLIITSYDAVKDTDNSLYIEVNADGAYKLTEAPKDEMTDAAKK
ncbi:MAG: hypothetical protein NW215_09695 [Hyphomicrobiales bacterium]|nr:hypothetical protein [Hyphomicrobiales bacterium]